MTKRVAPAAKTKDAALKGGDSVNPRSRRGGDLTMEFSLARRMPAEWETHAATWIAWPHHEPDWPGKLAPIPWVYAEIVRALSESERVEILCHNESVAENASDSIVAPLLCFLVLGLPATACYRAINTLDAMIGYRGRFEHLGKVTARLDDLANLIPARVSALLLLAGGALTGADARSGWRVLRRDAGRTPSPNAGWPMAAMAGLLGVALEKAGHYRLGDARAPLRPEKIDSAWRIVQLAIAVGLALAAALLGALAL